MLTKPVTPKMVQEWKQIAEKYRSRLQPNRKSGQEILDYLQSNYQLTPVHDERASQTVVLNIMENEPLREKLPEGGRPEPVTFIWEDNGNRVFIGIDLVSGYFLVEGSEQLYDQLCAYQGLDEKDLDNYYCIARYIACLEEFDKTDWR